MNKLKTLPVTIWAVPALFIFLSLVGCGDGGPDSEGNNDTLLTGFSGVVIVIIVAFVAWRFFTRKRD